VIVKESSVAQAKYPVKSLTKALRLMDTLGEYQNGTSIATLAKKLGIGKSTVHRLLATLRDFDLAWFDPSTSNYALGARILRWSDLLRKQNLLLRHGTPILRELVQLCRETTNLAIWDGAEVIYIAQCESMEQLRLSQVIGTHVSAHCTALGKAFLSTFSEQEFFELYSHRDTLKPMTSNSITDKQRLWTHLQKVRQDGVAYDFEENVVGVVCLATTVRNHTGAPVAAMSISMPSQRMRGENLMTFKDFLVSSASRLSRELGYEGPSLAAEAPEKADSVAQ
jgi:DNA-binding IclR family transcriptional regulator